VQRGDTLYSIANKFQTDAESIRVINNLFTDLLRVGQELLVPTTRDVTDLPAIPNVTVYTVQRGDTLWGVARRYGVTISELKNANNLTNDTIFIGQKLLVPITQPLIPQMGTDFYIVRPNDTLWAIANRYGTTVDQLMAMNNLTSNVLRIGQILIVPIQTNM
jgi:LysM repeat protein